MAIRVIGKPGAGATLLLDRHPPAVTGDDEPGQVALDLTPEQAEAYRSGRLNVPNEAFSGAITFRGPVRLYLAVDPVLRHLLAVHGG
ncbi:hypothetical protein DSM112329_04221 [Paraconexibacter sp. AEG42_29]|uniref:SCP2 domain-containing protein n=1 Tax=Paraconexibacter sp. AEG42_29 TaxID=2997339 RepID=A0AAU7B0D1_9ACTN